MVIPFTYNILKRHPALMVMIHRTEEEVDGKDNTYLSRATMSLTCAEDPFLPQEPNPLLTQALSSSLWELYNHRLHYHSSVSSLSKILSEAFTKPGYAMEDFLDHTYHTVSAILRLSWQILMFAGCFYLFIYFNFDSPQLFDAEASHRIKKEPVLAMEIDRPMLRFLGRGNDESVQPSMNVISDHWMF
jgi:U3 small nucleolar RNA-associated protein 19